MLIVLTPGTRSQIMRASCGKVRDVNDNWYKIDDLETITIVLQNR